MRQRLPSWLVDRWLLWLIVIAFLALLISQRVRLHELERLLLQGLWQWVLVAVGLQVIYYLLYAILYQSAFSTVGVESPLFELLPVVFASVFVRVLAPVGGFGPAALFVDDARRRGQSVVRATEGVLLEVVAENVGVMFLLLAALAYLLFRGELLAFEAVGAGIFLVYVSALIGILLLGKWQPARVRTLLEWLRGRINALAALVGRTALADGDWAARNAAEFHEAAETILARPRQVGRVVGVALSMQLTNLATLYALFLAFRHPIGLGTLVAGLAFGLVFAIIYVLPYDIGVLQAVMILIYASLGVPTATAIVVAVTFGGLNAWLPILIGFFLLRRVRTFGGGRGS